MTENKTLKNLLFIIVGYLLKKEEHVKHITEPAPNAAITTKHI